MADHEYVAGLEQGIEDAEAEAEALEKALRKYGKHLTGCACLDEAETMACDCGWAKVQAQL